MESKITKIFFRQFLWVIIALIVLLILCFYFTKDIEQKISQIETIKNDLSLKESIFQKVTLWEEEWQKAQAYYPRLQEMLPTEKDLINLENKINNLDNNYPVQLSFRFGSKNTVTPDEPPSYNYSLTIGGKQEAVLSCLEGFQKLTPAIRIEQLELTKTSQAADEGIEIKLLGRIYLKNVE